MREGRLAPKPLQEMRGQWHGRGLASRSGGLRASAGQAGERPSHGEEP